MKIRIWTINKWLRWTGFRIIIAFDKTDERLSNFAIGFRWWGFGWIRAGEENWAPHDCLTADGKPWSTP